MNKSSVTKSILFLFLLTAFHFTLVSCDELTDVESGNYRVTFKGELSVIDLSAVPEQVTVPSEIEGRKVTVIAKDAFKGCQTVVNVTIENGIETIGESAFASCPSLVRVVIPESVTSIEDLAFSDCNVLYDVIVPENLSSLPLSVFNGTNGAKFYIGGMTNAAVYREISEDEFNSKVIEGSKTAPVFVKFGAYWCGPCRTMNQILPEVAEYFDGAVSFFTVEVDEAVDLANEYNIMNIPALFLFKDGKIIWKDIGLKEKDKLIKIVEEQLK